MARPVILSEEYLNGLNSSINEIMNRQESVELLVHEVRTLLEANNNRVDQLQTEFHEFMVADTLAKNVQLAQTQLNTIRQEVDANFGHYSAVRLHATGILQGMDAGLIPHSTIRQATEELMISTPRYWLAPALVALAAWIRDDKPLADRGLKESLRRDNDKTSLFFALVLRRVERDEPAVRWLSQYLARQDADRLGQEFAVLLDAVANGGFGPAAKELILERGASWYDRLVSDEDAVEAQVERWCEYIGSHRRNPPTDFPNLRALSPDWPQLENAYKLSTVFGPAAEEVRRVYEKPLNRSRTLAEQVDNLLQRLVTSFDEEEAPLRRKEAELLDVIGSGGDLDAARKRTAATQEAFDSEINFLDLLSNSALAPEDTGVSRSTQRLAIALCRDWADQAAGRLEAASVAALPDQVNLDIDGWSTSVHDATREEDVVAGLTAHFDSRTARDMEAVRSLPAVYGRAAAAGVGALTAIVAFTMAVPLLGLALVAAAIFAGAWAWHENRRQEQQCEGIRIASEENKRQRTRELRGALAELVDFGERTEEEREQAARLHDFLRALRPDQQMVRAPDTARGVIT
ncbi:hypothetical protein [Salininema proteolyticum]|uniref:Uncharacterized protein n=1 Tax=Salininema proteolyticum TaxID=1607685 RepID=A0ABV8TUR0_9ACTN